MGVEEWVAFFNSPAGLGAMGKILYDIYDEVRSAEERNAGLRRVGRRPGRSAVALDVVMEVVRPSEFTNDPFHVALARLIAGRSQRQFAVKVPITQPHLSRVLKGERLPKFDQMERLADAAGVPPWYFREWRAQYIAALIGEVLIDAPHLSISALKILRERRRRSGPPPR
jgi:transcriptional regulator with XRE-family HTH domain